MNNLDHERRIEYARLGTEEYTKGFDKGWERALAHAKLFDYEIGDDVIVVPLDLPGKVVQRADRGGGLVDYQVVFWSDGTRRDVWLLPHEIQQMPS